MKTIFNFNDYKTCLINYHHWGRDNSKERYIEREKHVNHFYSDDYLQNIINNTQVFISMLLDKMIDEYNIYEKDIYYTMKLPMSFSEKEYSISNGCGGGGHADELFYIDDDRRDVLISYHLIKAFFGDKFRIELGYDGPYTNSDEDIGCDYYIPTFHIVGSLDEFNKIYNDVLEERKQQENLVLVLRKIRDKK